MDKRFWAILAVIAVFVVGAIWISNNKKNSSNSNVAPTEHVEGSASTGVKLVEYGDYECPYCGEYFPVVKQIASMYANQMQFQFRNLPLTQLHPNAFAGARAAEAANLQGQFWQMHDLLYEQNEQYYASDEKLENWVGASDPETYFIQDVQQLGLNITKFKTDFAGAQVNSLINADVSAFNKTGAQEATPTFFLDGKQISPTETVASFESYINAAIKQKGFTPKPITTTSATPTPTTSTDVPNSSSAPQSKQ